MCVTNSFPCCVSLCTAVWRTLRGHERRGVAGLRSGHAGSYGSLALERQAASTNTLSRFETEVLATEDNIRGLERLNAAWVDRAMALTAHRRVILDTDSSELSVYGEQEGGAYNGLFGSVCYHPLFVFSPLGDCERAYPSVEELRVDCTHTMRVNCGNPIGSAGVSR